MARAKRTPIYFYAERFKNILSRFFNGEQWVLGDQGATSLDAAAIDQSRMRYQNDFVANWRAFLKAGSVVR